MAAVGQGRVRSRSPFPRAQPRPQGGPFLSRKEGSVGQVSAHMLDVPFLRSGGAQVPADAPWGPL